MARAHPASVAALALYLAVAGGAVARAQTTGTLQGTVVDARDGTPLEKVSVRIQDTPLVTITTSDGRFLLENVPSGHRELYVSAVDFVLTRARFAVGPLESATDRGLIPKPGHLPR